MKEVVFTLVEGKEIPPRLNGAEIRYTLPETLDEALSACGGDEKVLVSVFNEGFNLNHRQKIAKRFAAREDSSVETITAGMLAHKPGVAPIRTGSGKVKSERAKAIAELETMENLVPADQREAFRARLAALRVVKKPKAEATTAETPVASTEPAVSKAKEAPKAAAKGK